MLCFETQTRAFTVGVTLFAYNGTVEKIPRVKLHARFGGGHGHYSPGRWIVNDCDFIERLIPVVHYPVVVVPATVTDLVVLSVNAVANTCWCRKVERGVLNGANFTRGNEGVVDGCKV